MSPSASAEVPGVSAAKAGILGHDVELRPGPVSLRLVAVGDGYQQAAAGVLHINETASLPLGTR